jgi:hypothetical protein
LRAPDPYFVRTWSIFCAHLIHILGAPDPYFWCIIIGLVWILTLKSQFYDFRYQFRAFRSRFEHFKVQKMPGPKKREVLLLIWVQCQISGTLNGPGGMQLRGLIIHLSRTRLRSFLT